MTNTHIRDCYVAIELSRRSWLIGALLPEANKISSASVPGGDTDALLEALAKVTDRGRSPTGEAVRLRVCFEAGYDGFWLARFLIDRGIETTVLDASSFLVSRRGRRAKTDRLDIEAMASMMIWASFRE